MIQSYIFPDIEPLLVSHIQTRLNGLGTPIATGVRVGTVKLPASATAPAKEVVVTASYNETRFAVLREATAVVEVYANEYATASELALLVAAILGELPGDPIKRAEVTLGPLRLSDDGPQEKRSMTVDFTVKGADF